MLKIPPIESPFFEEHFPAERTDPELLRVARSLHAEGLAVVDFPDDRLAAPAEEIIGNLGDRFDWDDWRADRVEGLRIQDAWRFEEQVRAIAVNEAILRLLSQLYGRKGPSLSNPQFSGGHAAALSQRLRSLRLGSGTLHVRRLGRFRRRRG